MRRILVFVVACGGNDSSTPDSATPDAPYDTARCLIAGHYGDLGAKTGTTSQGPTTMTITLDAGPPRDSFFLKLTAGRGAFAGGLATGTFPITGAETSFNDCGVCTNIIADVASGGPQKFYFADSGSVTLTATSPPAGTIQNVHFVEITIATGQPVAGGCDGSITTMTFSGT